MLSIKIVKVVPCTTFNFLTFYLYYFYKNFFFDLILLYMILICHVIYKEFNVLCLLFQLKIFYIFNRLYICYILKFKKLTNYNIFNNI